jgi:hypothetical protein
MQWHDLGKCERKRAEIPTLLLSGCSELLVHAVAQLSDAWHRPRHD